MQGRAVVCTLDFGRLRETLSQNTQLPGLLCNRMATCAPWSDTDVAVEDAVQGGVVWWAASGLRGLPPRR